MVTQEKKYMHFGFLAGIYLIIACIQAYFTELHPDEAYYWVYSQHLDWGQFHQPPMVAVFIKMGYSLFQNELGVRLLTITTHLISLYLIYQLSKGKNPLKYFLFIGSLFLIQAGSIITAPDTPLVFFSVLFLWFYHQKYDQIDLKSALILGVIGTCILYSKYHGGVFLILLLLTRLQLLRQWQFYLIPLLAAVLYIPHILWQIQHDWISFKFHLFNRELIPYNPVWILEYIGIQLLILGPVWWWFLFKIKTFKKFSLSNYHRDMTKLSLFLFVFFLMLSLRNRVEANWLALAYPPLIIGTYGFIEQHFSLRKMIIFTSLPLLIFAFFRIELMTGYFKNELKLNFKYQYYKNWAQHIKSHAKGKPVVFANSYQLTSEYAFYSQDETYGISFINHIGNQFNYYVYPKSWKKDTVLLYWPYLKDLKIGKDSYGFLPLVNFEYFPGVRIIPKLPSQAKAGDTIQIPIQITDTQIPEKAVVSNLSSPMSLMVAWMTDPAYPNVQNTGVELNEQTLNSVQTISLVCPQKKGTYFLSFGFGSLRQQTGNSYFYRIEIN